MPHRSAPTYHLDANRVNARGADSLVNQLESWAKAGVIVLEWSLTAYQEAGRGAQSRSSKADDHHWVSTNDFIGAESALRSAIASILFPGGMLTVSQQNDVEILLTAKIAGAALVTEDGGSRSQPGGILGNRTALASLGIKVLSTSDAVREIADCLSDSPW